jgi:hypothetical protein
MCVVGQGLERWAVLFSLACASSFACAHAGGRAGGSAQLAAGHYAVESIRSRATLDGREQLIEISEGGTRMVDATGDEHTLTERGALMLASSGTCRLALAVSVDGEEPGVSDRTCTWSVEGDHFLLGDGAGDVRTIYRIHRSGDRLVLEGLVDVAPDGRVIGDAAGERIVLVQGRRPAASERPADRVIEPVNVSEPVPVNEI